MQQSMQQPLQQEDLKALAARVLARVERNSQRNTSATGEEKPCNKVVPDRGRIVAPKGPLSDADDLIATVCKEYSITRDWLDQIVICSEDVEDIKNGDLPLSCLRAHIEYHLDSQRKWQEFKQRGR